MSELDYALADGAYRYRTLEKDTRGWDVYALQSGLIALGFDLQQDGVFGRRTRRRVKRFQSRYALIADGRAGPATQYKLSEILAYWFNKGYLLPPGIPLGHIDTESGRIVGNHTAPYSNWSRDLGIVQINSLYAPMSFGFDCGDALARLCQQLRSYCDKYHAMSDVPTLRRAWELACGSWNRPAWTDALAEGRSLTAEQSEWIEGYIAKATRYTTW